MAWDHGTHPDFFDYYAAASQSETAAQRFRSIQAKLLRLAAQNGMPDRLDVADIGCGAGTQVRMWAELGHRVHGLDVNGPLIELAKQRARDEDLDACFEVGTATSLPWSDGSMDVCLMPELLEHVKDWEACVKEAARVLRPGGLLYLSTTNVLCPVQEEFNLPLYSWYPAALKRYCERLAVTSRPEIANYAKYPAVHWFSFYGLRRYLDPLGLRCLDRFDLIDDAAKPLFARMLVAMLRSFPPARFFGHVATPSTFLVATKLR
jgi:2-polyprenyl-6-hydroxyphenyl methylase/3-demethylubiquinone-9 3-methyltransferase